MQFLDRFWVWWLRFLGFFIVDFVRFFVLLVLDKNKNPTGAQKTGVQLFLF